MLQISLEVRQADNYLLLAMSSANPGSGASKDTIDTILGLTADVHRQYQLKGSFNTLFGHEKEVLVIKQSFVGGGK